MSRLLRTNLLQESINVNLDFTDSQQTSFLIKNYNYFYIRTPTITSVTHPTTGSVNNGDTVADLQGCTYNSDTYTSVSDGTLVAANWQLSLFSDFSSVLWDYIAYVSSGNATSNVTFNQAAFNNGNLPVGTTQYNVRVRYINSLEMVSSFSQIFTINI